ncbi:MAG: ABC transporter substrate-binding protein [Bryobacteraceae bacterium]|nr:ABC transporter substrate-binding protein [Bryobacteraceae bacterium]
MSAGGQSPPTSALKIGLLLPPGEPDAPAILQGARRGAEHATRELGREVELVVRGNPGQWGTEGDDAVALALDEGAQALIAPTAGTAAHQVLQVAGRTRIPVVSLCSDSSVTSAGIPWTVRIAPRTDEEAAAVLTALKRIRASEGNANGNAGGSLRVAAFVPAERAGREAAKDLRTAAATAAVELAEPIQVLTNTEPASVVAAAIAFKPEVILLWLDAAQAGRLAKALRGAGFTGRLAGHSRLCSRVFSETAGKEVASGVVFALPSPGPRLGGASSGASPQNAGAGVEAAPPGDEAVRGSKQHLPMLVRDWTLPEPTNALPSLAAALAFDATRLLAHVLHRAGDEPPFREFPLTWTLPGATGELAFDRSGNRQQALEVVEWAQDGLRVLARGSRSSGDAERRLPAP